MFFSSVNPHEYTLSNPQLQGFSLFLILHPGLSNIPTTYVSYYRHQSGHNDIHYRIHKDMVAFDTQTL